MVLSGLDFRALRAQIIHMKNFGFILVNSSLLKIEHKLHFLCKHGDLQLQCKKCGSIQRNGLVAERSPHPVKLACT